MTPDSPPRLSSLVRPRDEPALGEMLDSPTDRRAFLARASALTLVIPGVGAALAACSPEAPKKATDTAVVVKEKVPASGAPSQGLHNSDSRLDTAILKTEHVAPTTAAAGSAASATFHRYAPELPPLPAGSVQKIHWHAREAPVRIDESTVIAGWTFEGDIPGPIVHTRVGDTIEFTLTNDAAIPHSMDFHAAQVNPKDAFRSVVKGQSVTFSFKPKFAGAFMYHCGTAPVLMHIGSGMHGAIIVSPREPLPVAKEFVLIQSEYYLTDVANGMRAFDYQKMLSTVPDLVIFNGRPNQYMKEPIKVRVGDRVRFWVVSVGPQHPCNFHIVGDQFDTVYLGSPPGSAIRGVQTWPVAAGGGMCFEVICDIPGEFPFVNHAFGHGQKGAIGILLVEG